jgi:hypothetical protein
MRMQKEVFAGLGEEDNQNFVNGGREKRKAG